MTRKSLNTTPVKNTEIFYKRREFHNLAGDVTRCTDITIGDITEQTSIGCDGNPGSSCVWEGEFAVEVFNPQGEITYDWSVNIGSVQDPSDEVSCIIWVPAEVDTLIEVTCSIVSTVNGSSTMTKEFLTDHSVSTN